MQEQSHQIRSKCYRRGSHQGSQRAAMMYSFLATSKQHGVNPYEWLSETLRQINETKRSQLGK